jgi:hypothetical protein
MGSMSLIRSHRRCSAARKAARRCSILRIDGTLSGFHLSCGMQFPNRLFCRKNTPQSDDLEVLLTA